MSPVTGTTMAATDVPSYISARAANSLISENRPTRIQAETLLVLNRLLDELLLLILSSARSLATDRIKSDGMLKVLGNNLLAKDAVLEAELELRSYLDGKRAEGAKIPLGLLATSRLDGTEGFPVTSAYSALRIRCEYYSTLGDREDNSAGLDQNIMSSDGRPIATITPGVAIYVTALLEFVGEHILQNVARVIERDNSDEASLFDLKAALTEDELLAGLFNKMAIRDEVERRIEISQGRSRRRLNGSGLPDDLSKGGRTEARVVKPWQVPTEHELDEAAAPARFSARRASVQPAPRAIRADPAHDRASSSGHSYSQSAFDGSESVSNSATNPSVSTAATSMSASGSLGGTATSSDGRGSISRRQSTDKGWSGVFGQMKRRNSQRQSSDIVSGSFGKTLSPTEAVRVTADDSAVEPEDDFEALMLSGQTMKVSLTPNRLRTIEVAKQEAEAKKSARRRPGALVSPLRDEFGAASTSATPSPVRRASVQLVADSAIPVDSVESYNRLNRRPGSRGSLQAPSSWSGHPDRKYGSQPPSSYRSPSPALVSPSQAGADAGDEDADLSTRVKQPQRKMLPREGQIDRSTNSQDMVDFLRSAPSQDTTSSHGSLRLSESSSDGSRKVAGVGTRVRNLFGRKSSGIGKDGTASPPRHSVSSLLDEAHSHSGHVGPSGGSSPTSRAEPRLSSPLHGSLGRRSTLGQPNAPTTGEPSPRAASLHVARPSSAAGSPMQASGAPPGSLGSPNEPESPAAPAGAAFAGSTPTRAGPLRPSSRGTLDDRRSIQNRSGLASPSTVGLYEEPKQRPRTPPSPRARQRQDEIPSRKVPWGYQRYSASSHTRQDTESMGTPTSDKRRSIGYQSSSGHGGQSYRTTRGSTENGDTPNSVQVDEGSLAHGGTGGGRTPTLFYTTNGRRGSGAQSSIAASRDSSSIAAHQRPPISAVVALADLDRQMRDCTTAEECRMLVLKALSGTSNGGGVGPAGLGVGNVIAGHGREGSGEAAEHSVDHDGIADIPDEESLAHGDRAAASKAAGADRLYPAAARVAGSKVASADSPSGSLATGKAAGNTAPTSLEACDQELVVAWLLGGDDVPTFHVPAPSSPLGSIAESDVGSNGRKTLPRAEIGTSASAHKVVASSPYAAGTKAIIGSVASLVSTYKDASEGHEEDDDA